ncbi:hypothetical protein [Streptomyces venezuelae]|uniref:Uncharacterized protein n=1 Tax=Streptomyces venezuelae TaxID=54571 RepID=A0A5P2B7K9_STRVZ|nr:hypothetical protein [Streptomyces venezuelae]QES25880.1 hypothetical protein DEJ47_04895 [Streptomyces venezuelae]
MNYSDDDLEPETDEELYRNPVCYEPAGRNLDLDRPDLGIPEIPGLREKLLKMRGRVPVEKRGLICPDCRDLRRRRAPMYLVQRDGVWLPSHYRRPGEKPISHESDEHMARKERVAKDSEDHGFHAEAESSTPDGRARLDVRITGDNGIVLGYEPQLSEQTARSMRLREGFRRRSNVRSVWDFVDPGHAGVGTVPYVRTPGLPASVIRVQKNPIEVRDGNYVVEEGHCTPGGSINRCPNKPFDPNNPIAEAYCGDWHRILVPEHQSSAASDTGKAALTLTRFIVEAAGGARIPFQREGRWGWLPADHWHRYTEANGPEEKPADRERTVVRDGDRRSLCTEDRPASDFRSEPKELHTSRTVVLETRSAVQPEASRNIAKPQPPLLRRVTPGLCESGTTACGAPARLYPCGWRCDPHSPAAMARRTD